MTNQERGLEHMKSEAQKAFGRIAAIMNSPAEFDGQWEEVRRRSEELYDLANRIQHREQMLKSLERVKDINGAGGIPGNHN
jgi:hypothetical protein